MASIEVNFMRLILFYIFCFFALPSLVLAQPSSKVLSVPVVDDTHPEYGRGKYFTFENSFIDKIAGKWNEVKLLIRNSRTGRRGYDKPLL
jgi:hypothetical protein